jgi:hypothetical protein
MLLREPTANQETPAEMPPLIRMVLSAANQAIKITAAGQMEMAGRVLLCLGELTAEMAVMADMTEDQGIVVNKRPVAVMSCVLEGEEGLEEVAVVQASVATVMALAIMVSRGKMEEMVILERLEQPVRQEQREFGGSQVDRGVQADRDSMVEVVAGVVAAADNQI